MRRTLRNCDGGTEGKSSIQRTGSSGDESTGAEDAHGKGSHSCKRDGEAPCHPLEARTEA